MTRKDFQESVKAIIKKACKAVQFQINSVKHLVCFDRMGSMTRMVVKIPRKVARAIKLSECRIEGSAKRIIQYLESSLSSLLKPPKPVSQMG
ncbi:MAG: hypothetical protein CEO40_39 [Parcubacteria group bacterium LiPW_72]|nr:MAG: hypothetical protein CEO40_39 [Parcubacteria group bacterium LiPW_72]